MIYHCNRTDCPRCRTTTSTRIDVKTRMPVILHICTCEYRETTNCNRCLGMSE